jgi:hypothetical protein
MTTSFDLDSKKSSTGTLPPHIWAARISHIQRRWMGAFHSRHTVGPKRVRRLGLRLRPRGMGHSERRREITIAAMTGSL